MLFCVLFLFLGFCLVLLLYERLLILDNTRQPTRFSVTVDLLRKSMDWFLYDNGLRHERVKRAEKFRRGEDNSKEENIYVNSVL